MQRNAPSLRERGGLQSSMSALCFVVMPGLILSRFRALMLILAFGLGLAAQAMPNVVMAAQMQSPAQAGISSGTLSPGCDGDMQHGCGLAADCTAASCCTIPALPAQSTALEPHAPAVFPAWADANVAGIASAPDPHPPRAFLHS
jgi:hypothetical protein